MTGTFMVDQARPERSSPPGSNSPPLNAPMVHPTAMGP